MASVSMPLLKGKAAIVTGGTTGEGRGIVLEYLRRGCGVAVNRLGLARDSKHNASLLREVGEIRRTDLSGSEDAIAAEIMELESDMTSPEDCTALMQETVKRFGKLEVLVANAGIFKPANFLEMEPAVLEQTVKVNINGTFYAFQAAARQMVKQGRGGSIIGLSSISALQGGRCQTHYTPTKAGIVSFMQSMAIALEEHQIRCNALMPGIVGSRLSAEEINNKKSREKLIAKVPLGRPGEPQDMAGPVVFLAAEQMSGL